MLHAPALKIAPVQEDISLIEDTKAIIAARPDLCIATTAYGMRRWCEAADSFGIGEQLLETLGACRMFVRGPKARGAVRAAGLADVGISSDETTATLVDMLLAEGVRGKTVAVQLHGYTDVRQLERLRMSGATVLTVTPYRWVKPDGEDRLPRAHRGRVQRQPGRPDLHQRPRRGRRCGAPRTRWASTSSSSRA